jgi:hypothetical protein
MASRKQQFLSDYIDAVHGGLFWGLGDRQSDALARQIAMSPILAANAALLTATLTDSSQPPPPRASVSYRPNQAFSDEIDRQIARDQQQQPRKSGPKNSARARGDVSPGKNITLTLDPKTPLVSPKLEIEVDFGGDASHWNDIRLIEMTLGSARLPFHPIPIFPGKSAKDLRGVILEGMTISHDSQLKATFQNVSNTTKTVSISAES